MLKNYFNTTVRSIGKNKHFSFINTIGLAIGMAAVLVIFQYVTFEYSFDRFHENKDQIYRLNLGRLDTGVPSSATSAGVMGPILKDNYAGIKSFVRLRQFPSLVAHEDKSIYEEHFYFTDSSFFEVFSFRLLEGDKQNVLQEPNTIVLTESSALRLFGKTSELIGELIEVDNRMSYKIDGVVEDPPKNSHFSFSHLASIASVANHYNTPLRTYQFNEWYAHYVHTYFQLEENVDVEALGELITDASKKHSNPEYYELYGTNMGLYLQSLSDIHLNPMFGELGVSGDIDNLYILASAGIIILLLAMINYINLSTAQSMKRGKEMALRKTLGASRNQLIMQFLIHSVLLSLLSFVLAITLLQTLQGSLVQLLGLPEEAFSLFYQNYLLESILLVLSIGLLSGIYPAIRLSSSQPAHLFREQSSGKQKFVFRKVVIFLQFSISIALISSTIIVFSQVQFMQQQELGLDTEQILLLPTYGNDNIHDSYDVFRQSLEEFSDVQSSTLAELSPGESIFGIISKFEGMEGSKSFATIGVDYDYLKTYDIELIAGRDFSREIVTDTEERVIINKTLCEELGWSATEAIGKTFDFGGDGTTPGFVIGVVDDFHFNSLKQSIRPIAMVIAPNFYQKIAIKFNSTDFSRTIENIRASWNQVYPQWPFDYSFVDVEFDNQYSSDQRFGNLFLLFTFLGLFIGALGVYGLVQLITEYRRRELSIRKVLGAELWRLVSLLSNEYVSLMGLAFLLSAPLVYFFMSEWLTDFAFKVQISWWMIGLSLLAIAFICFCTIGLKIYQTAKSNPVDHLRYE
ncbi:ABC transporter permease [Roseivirga sp. E12]|uniref:ABC transporter permease n=1 Tax=Roseivirga sp. E12 TaxID=2819237 RepID=UPI001ABBE9F6|nr:ABC transporter permease [Roseivirga sp. E12]MBO3697148.1 ABC transporter permease [Roseivirga sp. E12]